MKLLDAVGAVKDRFKGGSIRRRKWAKDRYVWVSGAENFTLVEVEGSQRDEWTPTTKQLFAKDWDVIKELKE